MATLSVHAVKTRRTRFGGRLAQPNPGDKQTAKTRLTFPKAVRDENSRQFASPPSPVRGGVMGDVAAGAVDGPVALGAVGRGVGWPLNRPLRPAPMFGLKRSSHA